MLATQLATQGFHVFAGCLDANGEGAVRLSKIFNIAVVQLDVTNDEQVLAARATVESQLSEHGKRAMYIYLTFYFFWYIAP